MKPGYQRRERSTRESQTCPRTLSGAAVSEHSPIKSAESLATTSTASIELAYGLLWVAGTDRITNKGEALYQARQTLLSQLDKAGQARGIVAANALLGREDVGGAMTPYEAHDMNSAAVTEREAKRSAFRNKALLGEAWTPGISPKVGDTVIMFGEPVVIKDVTVAD